MISDVCEHVAQVGFWVNRIEFSRTDQSVEGCGPLPSGIGAGKQIVLATECNGAQSPFRRVVVDLKATVVAVTGQCLPQSERITDGHRRIRLAGQLGQRDVEPLVQGLEQGSSPCVANLLPLVWRASASLFLNGI